MKPNRTLTAERLREVLDYNPGTGIFVWKVRPGQNMKVGDVAGGSDGDAHWRIRVDGIRYRAHRLAWFYMTGEWPARNIDHRDLNGFNNAWANLRVANYSQNGANRAKLSNNTSGVKGVCRAQTKSLRWVASITVEGVDNYLGTFDCIAAAQLAYGLAAHKAFGEFARMI